MLHYGVENPFQSEKIKLKMKETNLIKYGVEHASQSKEIREKIMMNSFKSKNYIMPSGICVKVHGYEPYCLDDLLQSNIPETEILKGYKDMPYINYLYDNKNRKYFPDIYLPSKNLLIEIKSEYTYGINTDLIFNKLYACMLQGYNVEIRVYNKDGSLIINHPSSLILEYLK